MRTLTLRSGAIRPTEREAVRMRVPEPLYDKGRHMPSSVQKVVLPRRHILRCSDYAKCVRGKWISAERAISGSRWNWYMCRGRTSPKAKPPEVQKTQFSEGTMKEIEVKKGKKRALEKEMETHDANTETRPARTRTVTVGQGTVGGASYSFSFGNSTTQPFGSNLLSSSIISSSPGTRVGNPDNGTAGTTANPAPDSWNRIPAPARVNGSEAEGTAISPMAQTKIGAAELMPRLPLSGAKSHSFETGGRTGDSRVLDSGAVIAAGAARTASENENLAFYVDVGRTDGAGVGRADAGKVDGASDGKAGRTIDGGAVRIEWTASNGATAIAGNPNRKEVGYISSWRKREFQLKVTNACAEPE